MRPDYWIIILPFALILSLVACRSTPPSSDSLRLTHLYNEKNLENKVSIQKPQPLEWRFDRASSGDGPTRGWKPLSGIADLRVENGVLKGRTTNNSAVIYLQRTSGLEENDLFHSLEIRLRISGGKTISFDLNGAEKLEAKDVLDAKIAFPWASKALAAGEQFQTCTLTSPFTWMTRNSRHILIQPSDRAGETFEIESIKLLFRKDFLAGISTGVSWQGLSGIFQESIVMRAPEKLQFQMKIPENPGLELNLGAVENHPITFHLSIQPNGWNGEQKLLERTITRPQKWDRNFIDLSRFAGQSATLRLSLFAETPGTLGIWGNPVVRNLKKESAKLEKPQGVILIWTDTLRRDHLSAYGYSRETSPNIKKIAFEGVKFDDAISQASWTKVSTPSLMTSLYPLSNGVHEFYDRLPSSATTLAEIFYDAGYATLNYSGVLFTGKFTNLHQGFEEVNEDVSLPDINSSKTSREYMDRFLPWLEAHQSVPFFVLFHMYDPHDPYKPKPPYDALWADQSREKQHELETKKVVDVISNPLMKMFQMPSKEDLEKAKVDAKSFIQHNIDLYDGSIRGMDTEIGRLMERLRELGLDKKTLVIFAGDHGEEFLDHGKTFHGQSLYGELTNVALLFWGPGFVSKNKTVSETVQNLDVMPTILELCKLRGPKEMQGQSLVPLFKEPKYSGSQNAEAATWRQLPAISERANTGADFGNPPPLNYEAYSIISGPWKLVHHVLREEGTPEFELFDRRNDRLDQKDVAGQNPEIVKRLARELMLWKQKAESVKLKPDSDATKNMSPEEIERMRSLGYIQ